MKIEFHDAPPPTRVGHPLDPRTVEFMEALKANPGKGAKHPDKISVSGMVARLKARGFEAVGCNIDKKGHGDIWASWPLPKKEALAQQAEKFAEAGRAPSTPTAVAPKPAAPAGIVPAPRPPDKAGMGLQCADCDFATDPSHAAELDRHTRRMHDRPIYKTEKVPVKIEAAA